MQSRSNDISPIIVLFSLVLSTKSGVGIVRAIGIDIFSDRRVEVQAAMRDVDYGVSGFSPTK